MRWLALVALVACHVELLEPLDRVVDAPVTVDEVRARAKPPDVRISGTTSTSRAVSASRWLDQKNRHG